MVRFIQILLLINLPLFAVSQQLISSAGSSGAGTGVHLSWSVGEPVISTFASANVILTQGFHQGKLTVTGIDPVEVPGLTLKVYPNPAVGRLNVDVSPLTGDLHLNLHSGDGKLIHWQPVDNASEVVNLEPFAPGLYLLKISRKEGAVLQTFKILKAGQ